MVLWLPGRMADPMVFIQLSCITHQVENSCKNHFSRIPLDKNRRTTRHVLIAKQQAFRHRSPYNTAVLVSTTRTGGARNKVNLSDPLSSARADPTANLTKAFHTTLPVCPAEQLALCFCWAGQTREIACCRSWLLACM